MAAHVDDFVEFLSAAYRDLIADLATYGLTATIVSTGNAQHLLVVTRTAPPDTTDTAITADTNVPGGATAHDPSRARSVEITAENRPLPDTPLDVSTWALTARQPLHPARSVHVPATADTATLAATIEDLLG